MSTATYYCHNCEQRRQIVWQPTRACALCGSNIIDRVRTKKKETLCVFMTMIDTSR